MKDSRRERFPKEIELRKQESTGIFLTKLSEHITLIIESYPHKDLLVVR